MPVQSARSNGVHVYTRIERAGTQDTLLGKQTSNLNKLIDHSIEINNYQRERLSVSFLVDLREDDSFIDKNLARQVHNLDLAKLTEPRVVQDMDGCSARQVHAPYRIRYPDHFR